MMMGKDYILPIAGLSIGYHDFEYEIDDKFFEGDIGYHMRDGLHYFSRLDWQRLIQFINLHR